VSAIVVAMDLMLNSAPIIMGMDKSLNSTKDEDNVDSVSGPAPSVQS